MSRRTVSILTFIVLMISLTFLLLFMKTQSKANQAEEEAVSLIEYEMPVKQVHHFYWTTIQKAYFSLDFTNGDDERKYAIIEQDGGQSHYFDYDTLITQEEAASIAQSEKDIQKIIQVRLGLKDTLPIWEVTSKQEDGRLDYLYIDATTGDIVDSIENI
ncbi:PepSY domain-containing protein [Dolosicoccus paucivorans]|uniref:PepSY domain-containing protein n=1 Tax=Dolosicoccus paucivorans TaxID=84521 RepID=UPI000885A282|nr:PepSY domain-containing protein [Dolosicoccus paucivorans]SDI48411.1 Uncharacterized protein YpmB [Dolosicoccus paucivorans]